MPPKIIVAKFPVEAIAPTTEMDLAWLKDKIAKSLQIPMPDLGYGIVEIYPEPKKPEGRNIDMDLID